LRSSFSGRPVGNLGKIGSVFIEDPHHGTAYILSKY